MRINQDYKKLLYSNSGLFLTLILLIAVSLFDLLAPLISSTIWRQTQTAMLTENLIKEHFSPWGLYVNILGPAKPLMIYEFPSYNFITGIFLYFFGDSVIWGKFLSMIFSVFSLIILTKIIRKYYGQTLAVLTAVFFIFSPLGMLVRTSFQPDSMGLMFLLLALYNLLKWRLDNKPVFFVIFIFSLLLSGLTKFPIIVPYIPFICFIFLFPSGKLRVPSYREICLCVFVFIVPLILWNLFALKVSNPDFVKSPQAMFLMGDLARFLRAGYYIKPLFILIFYVFSGIGAFFFLLSFRGVKFFELLLLLGLPLYAIIIPTSVEQHYYQFAVIPIISLFIAKGFLAFSSFFKRKGLQFIIVLGVILYIGGFLVATQYLLRQDKVSYLSAKKLSETTRPEDLCLFLVLHDRLYVTANFSPIMSYFSRRKGWNLAYGSDCDYKDLIEQVEGYKQQGARFLLVTWHTPDLEPWFAAYIPRKLLRDPMVNGKKIYENLKNTYIDIYEDKNCGILLLR